MEHIYQQKRKNYNDIMILLQINPETYKLILGISGGVISILLTLLLIVIKNHISNIKQLNKSIIEINITITKLSQKTKYFEKKLDDLNINTGKISTQLTNHERRIQYIETKQQNCPVCKKNNR